MEIKIIIKKQFLDQNRVFLVVWLLSVLTILKTLHSLIEMWRAIWYKAHLDRSNCVRQMRCVLLCSTKKKSVLLCNSLFLPNYLFFSFSHMKGQIGIKDTSVKWIVSTKWNVSNSVVKDTKVSLMITHSKINSIHISTQGHQ